MFRVARHQRILVRTLVTAVVATVAATAPAAASAPDAPSRHAVNIAAATCGGPNEIIECAPPVEGRHAAVTDRLLAPTCGGPNEIVECARPRP